MGNVQNDKEEKEINNGNKGTCQMAGALLMEKKAGETAWRQRK